ncbi:hypothetical protein GCM10008995_28210 [Halobellus salinus]|uniref:Uncharacterized protein n=1 Tax=Halobellus salinus TaxID=931585 RepID=A0A830EW93_9EURY|nr:hypothetical protein [Halobellus salinus]GGJ16660.1 hypothetical protein GCM10008995_28210 [Halobellus salinus]SMP34249.1 conserved repeat domain-containing protein [Halobellus salinus]
MRERLDRRALLALIGAAVGAGCNGRDPESDTDVTTATPPATPTATATPPPAEFRIAYEHPTNVEVGQTVTITVTVTNTGGRAAAFGASPSVTRPSDTRRTGPRQELGAIAPGETVTVTSPVYDLDYLGRYTFRFGASAPATTIRTRPATLAWDRAYQVPPGYQLRVGAPELRQTYSYVTPDGIDQERADPGEQWAFVPIEVANPTDDATTAPAADDFTLFPSDTPYDRTALTEQPIYQGQPYVATTLQPERKHRGYIPYAIPAGSTVDDVRIVWAAPVGGGTVAVSWQSAGLPPYRGD